MRAGSRSGWNGDPCGLLANNDIEVRGRDHLQLCTASAQKLRGVRVVVDTLAAREVDQLRAALGLRPDELLTEEDE